MLRKSFDSHRFQRIPKNNRKNSLSDHFTDIDSDSDWDDVIRNPRTTRNKQSNKEPKRNVKGRTHSAPHPQRIWDNEHNQMGMNQVQYYNIDTNRDRDNRVEAGFQVWENQKSYSRPNSPQRSKRIENYSHHLSDDEGNVIDEKARYEDGW